MLETLIDGTEGATGFLDFLYNGFVPSVGIASWLDIIGLGTAFVGGAKKERNIGLTGLTIALLPEISTFSKSVVDSHLAHFDQDAKTLFYDFIGHGLFIGGAYVGGLALGAYVRARQRAAHYETRDPQE